MRVFGLLLFIGWRWQFVFDIIGSVAVNERDFDVPMLMRIAEKITCCAETSDSTAENDYMLLHW